MSGDASVDDMAAAVLFFVHARFPGIGQADVLAVLAEATFEYRAHMIRKTLVGASPAELERWVTAASRPAEVAA